MRCSCRGPERGNENHENSEQSLTSLVETCIYKESSEIYYRNLGDLAIHKVIASLCIAENVCPNEKKRLCL